MPALRSLRLGTRQSLLAVAQSRSIARALSAAHPGLNIELITLSTRGDRDLTTPLPKVQDPDFFSAELDKALLTGRVDLCVHSLKDLDKTRPVGITLAALPPRAEPRDAVIFAGDIASRLVPGQTLRIGTCSTRRTAHVAAFLPDALPCRDLHLEFHDLRGAVDARLQRLTKNCAEDQRLDAVVLALAGLERLWQDRDGRTAIATALQGARWMILPLSECPAAAGQGALAVECRSDDRHTRDLLAALHDSNTATLVAQELAATLAQPAEMQDGFGATAIANPVLGPLLWTRTHDGAGILHWPKPVPPVSPVPREENTVQVNRTPLPVAQPAPGSAVFIAHAEAAHQGIELSKTRNWVSGINAWRRLAADGIWVEGCAENLGFAELRPLLSLGVLELPKLTDWTALTHAGAVESWQDSGIGTVLASYRLDMQDAPQEMHTDIATGTHFYWNSSEQYQKQRARLPRSAHHACGAGKTLSAMRAAGLTSIQPFPSRDEWRKWLA